MKVSWRGLAEEIHKKYVPLEVLLQRRNVKKENRKVQNTFYKTKHSWERWRRVLIEDTYIPRGGALSTYAYGGSVKEIFMQPKNITSASLQPKNISSFFTYRPVHEPEISQNNANRSQDCL